MERTGKNKEMHDKFNKKFIDYILSLGNKNHPKDSFYEGYPEDLTKVNAHFYLEGSKKYEELVKQNKQPLWCKTLDNIIRSGMEPLRGDVSKDPVYIFLKDLEGKVEDIAEEFYGPLEEDLDGLEELDCGAYFNSKLGFVSALIRSFENRAPRKFNFKEKHEILTQERYNWLKEFAQTKGNNEEELKSLVESFPEGLGFTFYWPCG